MDFLAEYRKEKRRVMSKRKVKENHGKRKRKYYILLLIIFTDFETFLFPIQIIFSCKRGSFIPKIFNNITIV